MTLKKALTAYILLIFTTMSAYPQTRQAVIKVNAFTAQGVGSGEVKALERLVISYIVEMKLFRVTDDEGRDTALAETETALALGSQGTVVQPLSADYVINGSLSRIADLYAFTLEILKISNGERLSVSDTAESLNDIVLRSRALTKNLFGKNEAISASNTEPALIVDSLSVDSAQQPSNPAPSLSLIAGSWKGDKGLETVRMFPNGTALGILSGGGSIKLKVAIQDDTVIVQQDQPNDPAMYRGSGITLEVARAIASKARPMSWIFKLDIDGKILRGIKKSVSVKGEGKTFSLDNSYERDALWEKISR